MTIAELIEQKETRFSIEVLPPLKGNDIEKLYQSIDKFYEYGPSFINITSHRDEVKYVETKEGLFRKEIVQKRPGTVAVSFALSSRYKIPVVPHLICNGFSREETESALIDLNYLGINNIFLLKGDASRDIRFANTEKEGRYAIDLIEQVNNFNKGIFYNGQKWGGVQTPFSYGATCYPEKHFEAPNLEDDLYHLKKKVEAGASYLITQMFFDNQRYFDFVKSARDYGIDVPIIPGLKPISALTQYTMIPKVFFVSLPEQLSRELRKCKDNEAVRKVGEEWTIQQAKELIASGVPLIHFYTYLSTGSVVNSLKALF